MFRPVVFDAFNTFSCARSRPTNKNGSEKYISQKLTEICDKFVLISLKHNKSLWRGNHYKFERAKMKERVTGLDING